MAKSYHLKDIIDLESGSPYFKSFHNFFWNKLKVKKSKPVSSTPLDEMAVWNAALQLDPSLANLGGRPQ